MKRKDGRDKLSLRKIRVEFDVLKQYHGSCKLTQGGTSVIASVLGPSETSPIFQHPTQCTLKVDFSSPYIPQNQNFHHATFIKKCFEKVILLNLHPMKRIIMSVNVLSDDGCSFCVAINALTFALMTAGVNMKGCVLSVGVGITEKKEIFLDPLKSEKVKKTFFVLNPSKEVADLIGMYNPAESEAFDSEESMMVCLAGAREAIKKVHEFVRISMKS